jgi:RNA polymerase sigma-70 factor (ECF subfamily)
VNDDAIWNKHRDELIRYASMLVGPDDAEDLVSTVVVRVLSRRRLADLDDARSYLFRSVLNEARSLVRRRRRRPVQREADVLPVDIEPEVLAAVLALPRRQRAAVYLTYWRDLPVAEVADLMGCRPGSVKRYLHIARNRLREVFDDD